MISAVVTPAFPTVLQTHTSINCQTNVNDSASLQVHQITGQIPRTGPDVVVEFLFADRVSEDLGYRLVYEKVPIQWDNPVGAGAKTSPSKQI